MHLLQTILAFVFALGVLVVIHELGHYLVARWCGVKVLRFSFGFGRTLWMRRAGKDNTEWAICAFPLGGYVRMLDERESETPIPAEELPRAFTRKSVWARSLIVVAGPLANFLLAIVLYWGLFMGGQTDMAAQLGPVAAESAIGKLGGIEGARILAVGDTQVQTWSDLRWAVMDAVLDGGKRELLIQSTDGHRFARTMDFAGIKLDERLPDPMQQLGFKAPTLPIPSVVGRVAPGSAAERADLKEGDRILAVDGHAVDDFRALASAVSAKPGQRVELTVSRGGQQLTVLADIERMQDAKQNKGRLGVEPRRDPAAEASIMVTARYGPLDAMRRALDATWNLTSFSLKAMWQMVRGELSLRNVSGPITIADYAGRSAEAGVEYYIGFLALISISLGVLNLMPVPLLDGGHLLYHVAEIIRGKPLSERIMELGQRVGLALLGCLMLLAFFNDINRQISGLG